MGSMFGGGSTSSTTETNPWGPAKEHLENILNNAGNLFDSQGGINADYIDKEIADLTPEMQETVKNLINSQGFKDLASNLGNATQQGLGGIGQGSNILGGLAGQGITADNIKDMAGELYNSELVSSQTDALQKNVQEGLDKSVQQLNQQSSGSGNMGSSRAGVAQGVMTGKASEAIAEGTAAIQGSAMDKAIASAMGTLQQNQNTALNAGQQLGNLGIQSGQLQSGLGNMYQQMLNNQLQGAGIGQNQNQNILNNNWLNAQGQQNMGWDQLNKYLNIAGGIGSMGGTSTQTGKQPGNVMGGMGSLLQGVGSMSGWKSDARLKDDVKVIVEQQLATDHKGEEWLLPALYSWTWNEMALELFKEHGHGVPPTFGVLAQELEDIGMGELVHELDTEVEGLDGKVRVVNYNKLAQFVHVCFDKV